MNPSTSSIIRIAGTAAIAALLHVHVHAQNGPIEYTYIRFDELPRQSADGLSYEGLTFSSPGAFFNDSLPGPSHADPLVVDDHALVGSSGSLLGIAFDTPPKFLGLTFAFDAIHVAPSALQIAYYDLDDNFLSADLFETTPPDDPALYQSGFARKYTWIDFDWPDVKVSRIELTFASASGGASYAIDQLYAQYTGEPIPESGTWWGGMTVAALACYRWQCRRRSERGRH